MLNFSNTSKKTKLLLIAILSGVALITVAGIIIGCMFFTSSGTDLSDYVEIVNIRGYNGSGEFDVSFNYVELAKDLGFENMDIIHNMKKAQEENGYTDSYMVENNLGVTEASNAEFEEAKALFDSIELESVNNGELSNGDLAVARITVFPLSEYAEKLTSTQITQKVKGLKDPVMIELDFDCSFVGYNGSGSAECSVIGEYAEWQDYVTFEYEGEGNLSNGNKICVTAYVDSYAYDVLEEGHFLPESVTKEFTVKNLTIPLTLENCTDDIIDQAEKIIQEEVILADTTLVSRVSMVYFVEGYYSNAIVVALEFPDENEGKTWNHIRYLDEVGVTEDGELKYSRIGHVLSGNGFTAKGQADRIEWCDDFDYCTLTKLR